MAYFMAPLTKNSASKRKLMYLEYHYAWTHWRSLQHRTAGSVFWKKSL